MARVEVYILDYTQGVCMGVFKQNGETFYYRFMVGGKRYFGVCVGSKTPAEARKYEEGVRRTVDELSRQKSVKALVENFKAELAGGEKLPLDECWAAYLELPSHPVTPASMEKKKTRWQNFVRFMKDRGIVYLHQIGKVDAQAYVASLRGCGKSGGTANLYQKCAEEICRKLLPPQADNPFAGIGLLEEDGESREAFSEKELEQIMEKASPFIRSIFLVGFFTALREGDISTLRWSDVLWDQGIIRRKLLKTGATVEIPIMPPLAAFLREQAGRDSEFVLPEHAAMYKANPTGISYRVKKFLEGELGIVTTKKVPGRTRAVSIKDVHSLRHTFCYFAGVAGIPLVVVQSIVGHMTPEMTAHYTAHADRKTKREKLAALPCFRALVTETERKVLVEQTRSKVIAAIKSADAELLNRVAALLLPPKPKRSLLRNTEPEKSK